MQKEISIDKDSVIGTLNRILEAELAGVVRYTHYSLMVYGFNRIPIVSWLREQATESMQHAQQAGEMITSLGGHPSLSIGQLLETHKHDIAAILEEALQNEMEGLRLYRELMTQVEGKSVFLEEYARQMVFAEEEHLHEVDKMLRKPGELHSFTGGPKA
jgi:bacterioferritin